MLVLCFYGGRGVVAQDRGAGGAVQRLGFGQHGVVGVDGVVEIGRVATVY